VEKLASALRQTYVAVGEEAGRLIDQGSDMLQGLFTDLDVLLDELQVTVETFRTHPAELLFGGSQPLPGPGEDTVQ
jgi:cystathionine beta-lyase family protein involved in aluminum resistance